VDSEATAHKAFEEFLRAFPYLDYEQGPVRVVRFRELAWLLYAEDEILGQTELYIGDARGFRLGSLDNVLRLHQRAYPDPLPMSEHRQVIDSVIELHQLDEAKIISGNDEIPGYETNPLDADLQDVVRPPSILQQPYGTSGSPQPSELEQIVHVIYTYRRLGGVVSRYRFQFLPVSGEEDTQYRFYWAEYTELARLIGDHTGLD
jgi:hypothetical protein